MDGLRARIVEPDAAPVARHGVLDDQVRRPGRTHLMESPPVMIAVRACGGGQQGAPAERGMGPPGPFRMDNDYVLTVRSRRCRKVRAALMISQLPEHTYY